MLEAAKPDVDFTLALKRVTGYLFELEVQLNPSELQELSARLQGYESSEARNIFEEASKNFKVFRASLEDYSLGGILDSAHTRFSPCLFSTSNAEQAEARAIAEATEQQWPVAIFDDNWQLRCVADGSEKHGDYLVYLTLGDILNPYAEIFDDGNCSGGHCALEEGASNLAYAAMDAMHHVAVLRRKTATLAEETQVLIVQEYTGKILWRCTV